MNQPTQPQQSESAFQQQCFLHHCSCYPNEKGRLFMVYNTPPSAAHGTILIAMGMLRGVSDLVYLCDGGVVFIELKIAGGVWGADQKWFCQMVRGLGWRYELVWSFAEWVSLVAVLSVENTKAIPKQPPSKRSSASGRSDY